MAFDRAVIQRRLRALVDSNLFEHNLAATRERAQLAGKGATVSNGRVLGLLARKTLHDAAPTVIQNYLSYCKDENADPARAADLPKSELHWLRDQLVSDFTSAVAAAAAFGHGAGELQIFKSCIAQWDKEAETTFEGVASGRLHGVVVYRHEHRAWTFFKTHVVPPAITALIGFIAGRLTGGNAP